MSVFGGMAGGGVCASACAPGMSIVAAAAAEVRNVDRENC